MGALRPTIRRWVAVSIGASLLSFGAAADPATRSEPGAASNTWPRAFIAPNGATVTIHQPQIAEWPNQAAVAFYAAVTYRPAGAPAAFGTVAVEADTAVALRERRVDFSRFAVADANFPTLKQADVADIVALIERRLPPEGRTVALDDMLAAFESRRPAPKNVDGLKADPPVIFVSTRPAILVNIDGSPSWRQINGSALQYAVNTNWDLVRDPSSGTCYLRDGPTWLTAANVLGPWTRSAALPASFKQLPKGSHWDATTADEPTSPRTPAVFVSRQPAELMAFDGEPEYQHVAGTAKLRWVSNTVSDVFREGVDGTVYYLVSGRWFAAPDFTGPWTFATPRLPEDFTKIALDHPRSRVLASVPGTPQAAEAALVARARYSMRVSKKLKAPAVAYDGPPAFRRIAGTSIARAVNTDKDVFKAGPVHYMCFDGVWFVANAATGPWKVTGTVPDEMRTIPPSSPAYRVAHVLVEGDDDDWTVFATTAAYTGMMVAGDTVVWGTGIGSGTYGAGAWYNPWAASFGRAPSGYGPPGAAPLRARPYESWDALLVQPADRPAALRANGEIVGTSGRATAIAPVDPDRSVYAGRDGSVYRQRAGAWEKHDKGGWVAFVGSSSNDVPIRRQLDEDARARAAGAERSRAASGLASEWGARAASYRPAGSAVRGRP